MALGQGVVVTEGYRSYPSVQGGTIVTTGLTPQPPFPPSSDRNIRTSAYTLAFAVFVFSSLALALQR